MSADAAGALKTALAFPAINGASASDPRTGDRGGRRAGWFVAFDGDASAYAGYSGGAHLGGKYLVVMTDAHEVAPAIDASAPAVAYARAGVRLLAAKGATVITSDWTDRSVVSYSVGSRHYDSARKRSPFGVPRPVTLS
jgi:hypothetical protein